MSQQIAKGKKAITKAHADQARFESQATLSFPITPTWRALSQLDKALGEVIDIMNNPHDKTLSNLNYDVEAFTAVQADVQNIIGDLEDAEAAAAGR